ncbi:hypothetical protein EW145_g1274 [Phellinidium pouzarii]|uniref:Uncharacterized protein n=1 Tax=Phellinidium pouzarii TaxID=167371 RepID=A0A4S4LKN7_9AGAM|nr:hypothetical protein EW145_g1274 [Phellinidium pouzarii]
MLYFSSTGFLVNDDRISSSPEWTLPSPTGIIPDLNICSPAMHWPYFSTTGRTVNGHFGFPVPISPSESNTTVASSSRRPLFDPFDDFGYPSPYADHGKSTANRGNSMHQGRSPSLVKRNHRTGDAPASPPLRWDTVYVNSKLSAITLIQRVSKAEDVEVAVSAISKWENGLSWHFRNAQLLPSRLAAARLFSEAWDPAYGHHFLNFDEKDVFVIKKHLPLTYLDFDQLQHLVNTTRGSVVSLLYGKLLEANILTSADVVVACEMLLEHHHIHGYMQGLWELLGFAGDKVCRKATILRMKTIQGELRKAKCNSSLYEVQHYADIINQLIKDFILVQKEKTKATLPKGKKEQRRKLKLLKSSGGSGRRAHQLTY